MNKEHHYTTTVRWTGNEGSGTDDYRNYARSHDIVIENKPTIAGSSDTPFRGDGTKHNPEDFLLASLSSCHMLWYLHLCADAGVILTHYEDRATGTLTQSDSGSGRFTEVVLHPTVTVSDPSMVEKARTLHERAHAFCFIANSVNFLVKHEAQILVENS